MNNKKIPTRFNTKIGTYTCKDHYINYNGYVFLIEESSTGTLYQFQLDGTSCRQTSGRGNIVASFKTTSKYFNSTFWYKLVRWFISDNLLLFDTKNLTRKVTFRRLENSFNSVKKELIPFAVSGEKVLNSIIKHASQKTGLDLNFAYPNQTQYGKMWSEAYVPVLHKDKKFILTWSNCD